jgi:hypothetical protein
MTPQLDKLDLNAEERAALQRQGFVSHERRRGCVFFRLRFRLSKGKQCVRYLGSDPLIAAEVHEEVARLQAARRIGRELGKLIKETGRKLKSGKERMTPILAAAEYHFHGLSIRRKRVVT